LVRAATIEIRRARRQEDHDDPHGGGERVEGDLEDVRQG
jgi:hypothetical protein